MGTSTASISADALREAADDWRRLPLRWHLAAVLMLVLLALARWSFLRAPIALGDEDLYLQAFTITRDGGSPYDVDGYFYPLTFARGGAALLDVAGPGGTLGAMRGANLLGLAATFWLATAWLPMSNPRRWLAAAGLLCLSPAVHAGLDLGNISFFIVGLTLAALLVWPRRPLIAGGLLGTSVALKPIAAAVIPILGIHRPQWPGRRHLPAAAAAGGAAAVLLMPISGLRDLLGQEMVELAYARSFSLQRVFALIGVDASCLLLTLTASALAVALVRWRPISAVQLLCYGVATISLVTPLVWNHTLIVALPVQGLALALAWNRFQATLAGDARQSVPRRYEPLSVAIAVAMMHAGTTAGFDNLHPWIQLPLLLAVGLTPAALCAYVFRLTPDLELPAAHDIPRPPSR